VSAGLVVERLGCVPYAEALALQERRLAERRAGAGPDRLLLLEHPPVVTLGRGFRPTSLLVSREELARRGIELCEVARGGDATYHGPGQLVGYPIVDLAARGEPDVHRYLRRLEAALGRALAALGVASRTLPGKTGVFVDDPLRPEPARKIASIGVAVRGWVTLHGFALNVSLDPAEFGVIVPCGLADVAITSVAWELGAATPADLGTRALRAVEDAFLAEFPAVPYSAPACPDGSSRCGGRSASAGSSDSTSR
jgi:lipoate-protein ligase B